MAHPTTGATAKSHKSHKTDPVPALAGGTFSTELATVLSPEPPSSAIAVPTPETPEKQWWYRPPDSKIRKTVEKIVVMDVAGWKDKDIAKKLGTTPGTVAQWRYLGRKNGWIRNSETGEEEIVDVEAELAMNVDRKIVRNIDASLDGHMTNWQTHEMTIAAAKGRGIFKGELVKTEPGELSVVAIQVVMPPVGVSDQRVDENSIGGTPAYLEGETIERCKMHSELVRVFDYFSNIECAIVGSATRQYESANDIDVLVLSTFDVKTFFKERGFKYLGGFDDANGNHVRRCKHITIPGVNKPVQILQWSTVASFEEYPHCVLCRDGSYLNPGIFYQKV